MALASCTLPSTHTHTHIVQLPPKQTAFGAQKQLPSKHSMYKHTVSILHRNKLFPCLPAPTNAENIVVTSNPYNVLI